MFATLNSALPPSSYEFQISTNRGRSRLIGLLMRHTARKFAHWLRELAWTGAHWAHGLVLEWRCRRDIRTLQRFDDRALADIGLGRSEIECACRLGSEPEIQGRRTGHAQTAPAQQQAS